MVKYKSGSFESTLSALSDLSIRMTESVQMKNLTLAPYRIFGLVKST